jgi:hydroxymethylpyrimidine/phosphomethylpyrimidine kinase
MGVSGALRPPARVLTVAGSDSGGGAGIEADIKSIERLGGYAMAAVTAVTAQNTLGVQGVWPLPPEAVALQIRAVREDLGADAVKTGMLATAATARAVAEALGAWPDRPPLVVDPVLVAKGGASLLEAEAVSVLVEELLPLADLVTPNWPEAAILSGHPVVDLADAEAAGAQLLTRGAGAVLVKGGHAPGPEVVDLLIEATGVTRLVHPRWPGRHTHGTGCTLSAAVATALGQGLPLRHAVECATRYVEAALRHAPGFGAGHGPLGHSGGQPPWTCA